MKKKTDVKKMVEGHSEDKSNGILGLKLVEAVDSTNTKEKVSVNHKSSVVSADDLPDVSGEVHLLSDEDLAKATEEASKKKKWAETAGASRAIAIKRLADIRSIEAWDTVKELVEEEAALVARVEEIDSIGDENLRHHVEFSEFLNFIRKVDTNEQLCVVAERLLSERAFENGSTRARAVSKGEVRRAKAANGNKLPHGFFYVGDKCIKFKELEEGQEESSGQYAVNREFEKAIKRLSKIKKKEIIKKQENLQKMDEVSDNLEDIFDGKPGLYRFSREAFHDKKKNVNCHSGVAIVRLVKRGKEGNKSYIIEPVDGAGCFHWLSDKKGWSVTLTQAIFAQVHRDKVPSDVYKNVHSLAIALNKHLFPIYLERKKAGKRK